MTRTCADCNATVQTEDPDELAVCPECVEQRREAEKALHAGDGDPHGAGGRQAAANRGLHGLHGKK